MVAKPGRCTAISQPGPDFSDLDKAFLVLTYPRSTPHPKVPWWTIEHALTIAGVPKESQQTIIGDRSPDGIRERFRAWNNPSAL